MLHLQPVYLQPPAALMQAEEMGGHMVKDYL
jgi:hypothetical protein